MRMIIGFCVIWGWGPFLAVALDVEHATTRGTVRLTASEAASFQVRDTAPAPDVLYPGGRMLVRLENESGVAITISFDESHCFDPVEQRAFREVTAELAETGSPHHLLRAHRDREWIYQVFIAPSDAVVTAQTFVEGHPLAVVFWLPRQREHMLQHPEVEAFMANLVVEWVPFSPSADN